MRRTEENARVAEIIGKLWRSFFQVTAGTVWRSLSKTAKAAVVLGLFAFSFADIASAQGTAQERAACMPDVFRLCSAHIPNENSIIACLKAGKAKLSTACRAVFDKRGV